MANFGFLAIFWSWLIFFEKSELIRSLFFTLEIKKQFFNHAQMEKEMAILGVSVITLFVAGFAAFAIYDLEGVSASAELKDYTTEFESIQTSLNQVNQKLEDLESDTVQELQKIKTQLDEVRAKTSPAVPIDNSQPFSISIDKAIYAKEDTIIIRAHNILPQKAMTIQLLSSFNELITTVTARSDSTGKLNHAFQIPSFVTPGEYSIKATTSDGNADVMFFKISNDIVTKSEKPTIEGLTVALDNSVYKPGEMIKVTGFGQKSTPITAEITSPTQEISTAHSSTSSDGTYTLIFILDNDAKSGNWKLKVTHGDHEESLSFTVKN